MKWQAVSLRIVKNKFWKQSFKLEKNIFHFFKTDDFQLWSMNNHENKIKDTWTSYKFIAKEYIHQFFPDEDYLLNKEKEPSLKNVIR